jgi:hypothetical protein
VRIAEMKKEAYEFKRDIVVGAENFRTGTSVARLRTLAAFRGHGAVRACVPCVCMLCVCVHCCVCSCFRAHYG